MLTLLFAQGQKRGLGWKRRWSIIKDDVLMFFEMKQDAIKQGWLQKKSSGSGTLGRSATLREVGVLKHLYWC